MQLDILSEIIKTREKMYTLENLSEEAITAKAEATSRYYRVLGGSVKSLRDEGYGVNLCETMAKGLPEVAQARQDMEKCESIYYSRLESLKCTRADLDILKTLLLTQRELMKGE